MEKAQQPQLAKPETYHVKIRIEAIIEIEVKLDAYSDTFKRDEAIQDAVERYLESKGVSMTLQYAKARRDIDSFEVHIDNAVRAGHMKNEVRIKDV